MPKTSRSRWPILRNNTDRWYTTQAQVDARQTLTCSNIKAAGITLYTVQISTDGTPVSPLLQQCASDSTKFFYLIPKLGDLDSCRRTLGGNDC